jgi:site-specific recombinase XerD
MQAAVSPIVFLDLKRSFTLHLKASNRSSRTIENYLEAIELFWRFLAEQGMPTEPAHLTREHVETFITALLERCKPGTAANRYRSLQAWFKWLLEEGEITSSPMARMKPPHVPEAPAGGPDR